MALTWLSSWLSWSRKASAVASALPAADSRVPYCTWRFSDTVRPPFRRVAIRPGRALFTNGAKITSARVAGVPLFHIGGRTGTPWRRPQPTVCSRARIDAAVSDVVRQRHLHQPGGPPVEQDGATGGERLGRAQRRLDAGDGLDLVDRRRLEEQQGAVRLELGGPAAVRPAQGGGLGHHDHAHDVGADEALQGGSVLNRFDVLGPVDQ